MPASLLAARTDRFVALPAVTRAIVAAERLTADAGAEAVVAQAVATSIARVPFLIGHYVATIAAGAAIPLRERHVGAAGVVGLEDLAHELEEVEQATAPEGVVDSLAAIALAELLAFDVGMRGVARLLRRVRLQGNDTVSPSVTDPVPVQADLEGSEVDVLQDNGFCGNSHRAVRPVDRDPLEFILQGHEVAKDFTGPLNEQG